MIKKHTILNSTNRTDLKYEYKLNHYWVATADMCEVLSVSTPTLTKYGKATNIDNWQTKINNNKIPAIRADVLLTVIKDISERTHFKRYSKNSKLSASVKESIDFLQKLCEAESKTPEEAPTTNQEEDNTVTKAEPLLYPVVSIRGGTTALNTALPNTDKTTYDNTKIPNIDENQDQTNTGNVVTPIDFNFMGHIIRFVGTAEKLEFIASDPIELLYPDADKRNRRNYLKTVPEKWKGHKKIMTPGGAQTVVTLYEPGLYRVTSRSDSPEALPFQEWLWEEVIPTIRKTGAYTVLDISGTNIPKLPSIPPGTFPENIQKYAVLTSESLDNTNLSIQAKTIILYRSLRETFPERRDFNIISQALSLQDLQPFQEEINQRAYHDAKGLAIAYSNEHKLSKTIDSTAIQSALFKHGLCKINSDKQWMPTDKGKKYCLIGWHTDEEIPIQGIVWRRAVLDVIGVLH